LSMLSPAWRASLCGEIGNSEGKMLDMDDEDHLIFSKVVALGCGESITVEGGLEELFVLVKIADKYRMEAILGDLEDAVMDRLTLESCGLILKMASRSGLVRLEKAGRKLALSKFDQFAEADGFMFVSEEVLGSLLDDDVLVSESEERVLKGVVRWMKGGAGGVIRGEGLLNKIRFPFTSGVFLANEARSLLPESARLELLVLESGLLKGSGKPPILWAGTDLKYLDSAVLMPRRGSGVDWADYSDGGERTLAAGKKFYSLAVHEKGFVCGGLRDGSIRVWNRATLQAKRTLRGHTDAVVALVSVKGLLISGSLDHDIRVWDAATGGCKGTLQGHTDEVRCLAVSGGRLVSGSADQTAKVWTIEGAVSMWRCKLTLQGHGSRVNCVALFSGDKLASGADDHRILVWDAGTGAREATLVGHEWPVAALAACGQRLISSSEDKTVRVWSTATWACVRTVQACPAGSARYIRSLALSGSTLVGGSCSKQALPAEQYELRVWDLETLEPLHALRQPAGQRLWGLASAGGEVWGAVGAGVVVWGWRG
jgi:hypothetical protein